MFLCSWHKTKKYSIENHFKTAGEQCNRLPGQQQRQELLHPQSQALQLSLSSHVRCVGEWRLWFLSLPACRFHQRGHRSVTQHPPPEKTPAVIILKSHVGLWSITPCQEKAVLIQSCSVWLFWVGCTAAYSACSSVACGFPVSILAKISKTVKPKEQKHLSM